LPRSPSAPPQSCSRREVGAPGHALEKLEEQRQ
jgi:hypothetical protein